MKSQVLHTVLWGITGEGAEEIWTWSFSGVKGATSADSSRAWLPVTRVIRYVKAGTRRMQAQAQATCEPGRRKHKHKPRVNRDKNKRKQKERALMLVLASYA